MDSSRWTCRLQNFVQAFLTRTRACSALTLNARKPTRLYTHNRQAIAKLELLEQRMLLSGSAISTEQNPILHVLPVAAEQPSASSSEQASIPVNAPLSDTFSLNSLAGANQTIYLDFNGNTTSGTYWNSGKAANLVTDAFSIDADPAFSDAELQRIQNIWQRVAEDFIPFGVNVTTEEPPLSDLIKSNYSDQRWGVRAAIGGTYSDWYGSSAGGVAYVGSFNWATDTPTFVFSETLYNDEKYVAEAVSHEVGHTLGLSHDGTSSLGYYTGHGNGSTGWAPIMGVGYYRELTQWSKGEYTDASQFQDDLSILTTNNGFGYRADDYGNSLNDATALTLSQNTTITNQEGIIEKNTDTDWFTFTTTGGAINLSIDAFTRGANLDALAELYNEAGTLILSSNPETSLNASLATTLAAGTYYVKIDGVGKGNLATGYSDYGSLGQYTISGTLEGISTPVTYSFGAWDANSGVLFSDPANNSSNAPSVPSSGPNGQGNAFTGDFDGDGIDELAVRDSAGNWWMGENNSGAFQFTKWGQWGSVSSILKTHVGDFNGDGQDDIAGLYSNGSWWVAISQGNSFVNQKWTTWGSTGSIVETYTGDFNGDGSDDIVGLYANGHWWVANSQGTSFTNQRWATWGSAANIEQTIVADFNNDGTDDIGALYSNGKWWIGTSNGSSFSAQLWSTWGSTSQIQFLKTGDFNGDGKVDIAGMYSNGKWWVGISAGNGFTTQNWTQWGSASLVDEVLVGDFNGDGNDDLIGKYSSGWWWMAQSQGNSFANSQVTQWSNGNSISNYFVGNFASAVATPPPADSSQLISSSSETPQIAELLRGNAIRVSSSTQSSDGNSTKDNFAHASSRWVSSGNEVGLISDSAEEAETVKQKSLGINENTQETDSAELHEYLEAFNQQLLDHSLYLLKS